MKLCFLVSGNGGNLKFFHLALKEKKINNINLFAIGYKNCKALEYCKEQNLKFKLINYARTYNKELVEALENFDCDYIVTTWHKVIDATTVNLFKGKLINLHYSLLPAFKGTIGTQAINEGFYKLNTQYFGATVHFVDEFVDNGKIISQAIVKRKNNINKIINLVFRRGCMILLNSLIILSQKNNIIKSDYNEKLWYSPSLLFNDEIFDETFWKKLSLL
ncbi:hypothetical protein SU69_02620 [Thermosipho melanesiensis]|uniref:phosphoribosylglycinamide formyltransferase 1 n=2 Tax=Thermosipho melanesiensis TaxID=46541 RepID=A6LKC6_THEM4|nr:formyltransferase family protein [Thermosipho melanesiensis]ABR30377.1 formyl transferase domain protein [Thermosipho melanesiensis BI429]APT74830.1 hypothetical protein BW47_02730 [Thermosipho melanesiensis]OOC37492.1 hypothetical protein SU68_02635 [Thermosipho melanesiensis]OOC39631.1 hypothetical protein SU69_02620 [Thermosipho melanesiensis]OOC39649.1 hypothetical protein SU70_02615 [Thermosipho melanesiensis]